MEPLALFLVLSGSLLHVGWNLLTKAAEDKLAFLWLMMLPLAIVAVFFLYPYFIGERQAPPVAWVCLIVSAVVHSFYFWSLANAYRFADLSLVYPYSRGIGALVATSMGIFFLHELPSLLGWLGIALTLTANFFEPLFHRRQSSNRHRLGLFFTMATGLAIAIYLCVDKVGVTYMPVSIYLSGKFFGIVLLLAPTMLQRRRSFTFWIASPKQLVLGSLCLASASGAVLAAMALAPLSYVVAARASGIMISGFVGMLFLQERLSASRWTAIAMITVGTVFLAIA